jgi:hypothetical protein
VPPDELAVSPTQRKLLGALSRGKTSFVATGVLALRLHWPSLRERQASQPLPDRFLLPNYGGMELAVANPGDVDSAFQAFEELADSGEIDPDRLKPLKLPTRLVESDRSRTIAYLDPGGSSAAPGSQLISYQNAGPRSYSHNRPDSEPVTFGDISIPVAPLDRILEVLRQEAEEGFPSSVDPFLADLVKAELLIRGGQEPTSSVASRPAKRRTPPGVPPPSAGGTLGTYRRPEGGPRPFDRQRGTR